MYEEKIRYLKKVFPHSKLGRGGLELKVMCPKCGDRSRLDKIKLCVRLDKDLFHCWICDLKGRSVGRLIKMVNPSLVAGYYQKFGNFVYNSNISEQHIQAVLPLDFKLLMNSLHDPDAKRIRRYAHSRGLVDTDIWRYRIGYAPSLRRRMVIPSFDESGILNYWTARAIDDTAHRKYHNASVPKTQFIVNEIDMDWQQEEVFIVEGPFDLMKCDALNATCLLGSSLSEEAELFRKLVMYPERIILGLDHDAWKSQDKIAKKLLSYDKEVWMVKAPAGMDWGDLDPEEVYRCYQTREQYNPDSTLLRMIDKI